MKLMFSFRSSDGRTSTTPGWNGMMSTERGHNIEEDPSGAQVSARLKRAVFGVIPSRVPCWPKVIGDNEDRRVSSEICR